ncbi:CaiB/BaiF CoA transferase family protein [Rhabdothermincola sp.]|mgnify:CR=1 FL=1|uniref:CaiB/BaiF CoA transferase family protein n=1 Tax=Rhabdothermincola sp. TaxID=2820405 RepID=UPI002FE01EA6
MAGPLEGIRVVEIAGLGPAPFGAMVLADLGADVVVVDRPDHVLGASPETAKGNVYARGRRSIAVDLKRTEGVEVVRTLARAADVFVEGFRPGVMERLGLGPEVLRADNPRLVYARMTGWGQEGPLADRAGHDLNYLGLAGPLAHIGRRGQPPTPPLNLVADFGGGGMLLALGVCAALVERASSGEGQVVDAAMVDGVALLAAPIASAYMLGYFNAERGTNWLDSGAHYYEVYETADGGWLSVGAIEPAFYANLLRGLGLAGEDLPDQQDASQWPAMKERFAAVFRTRTRDEWMEVFAQLDACVAPVLTFAEAPQHPHLRARSTYVDVEGIVQPAPAPRFDRTPASLSRPPAPAGHHTDEVLAEAGYDAAAIAGLRERGVVA